MKNKFEIIGEINFFTCRTELMLSNFYSIIERKGNPILLYNKRYSLKQKIKEVKQSILGASLAEETKKELCEWIDKFDKLRESRNTLIHSIVLNDAASSEPDIELLEFEKEGSAKKTIKRISYHELEEIIKNLKGLIEWSFILVLKHFK